FSKRLRNGNDVCEALQWMQRSAFKTYDRNAGVFDKLFDVAFAVVFFLILERRKRADAEDIKIMTEDRRRILDVLDRAAAHDGFILELERPSFLAYIKHDRLHTQVGGGDLCAQAGPHTWIEKQQADSLVRSQLPVPVGVGLIGERLVNEGVDVGY